jgi:hypothetical protein
MRLVLLYLHTTYWSGGATGSTPRTGSLNTVGSRARRSTSYYVLYLSISVSIDILAILLSSSLTQL